ncbi:HpcH/HpaI aldolase family protein [Blastococcus haudaquaticus]|uniref:4-hydroxy-2-oxoheptanedioate aldolase n=1 Tax=Blastococcus haudaquaticus TaxID=1938745 RepID=A0A286GTW9_9ACTN|nr:aldolase/citrate lyase family protein [Blastococcus haudaquaticus]SOD98985.1 4-hydroxy-2-oxoheptanedioate aldolase [Blastococcus haudaquaticus]
MTNTLQALWDAGGAVRGAWCAAPSSVTAEAVASVGYDYVCLDMQHGAIGYADAVPMLQAVSGRGATPIVRVGANDPAEIGKVLDAGALGVVVPMVGSAEEAARAVAACRYPPRGRRSYGPVRAATVFGSRAVADLEQVVCAVMVETEEGLDRVDEIAGTEGVSAIYVGPSDLALALGLPPAYEHDDPAHQQAIERIREACDRHGVIAGIHCDGGAMASRRLQQGFRMVTVVNDLVTLRNGVAAELAAVTAGSGAS